jgi:hypothetical protein
MTSKGRSARVSIGTIREPYSPGRSAKFRASLGGKIPLAASLKMRITAGHAIFYLTGDRIAPLWFLTGWSAPRHEWQCQKHPSYATD